MMARWCIRRMPCEMKLFNNDVATALRWACSRKLNTFYGECTNWMNIIWLGGGAHTHTHLHRRTLYRIKHACQLAAPQWVTASAPAEWRKGAPLAQSGWPGYAIAPPAEGTGARYTTITPATKADQNHKKKQGQCAAFHGTWCFNKPSAYEKKLLIFHDARVCQRNCKWAGSRGLY